MRRIAIIIPARLASTRFPAKPLAPLCGPDGISRPALSYTWATGCAAASLLGPNTLCVVATDDESIVTVARQSGMNVVLTPQSCRNGSERCAAALAQLGDDYDIIVNLQGDAPLTPPHFIAALCERLISEPSLGVATAAVPATQAVLTHLQSDAAAGRVGGTTVVCNRAGQALYFSKSIIPYVAPGSTPLQNVFLHLGVYAYRPAALRAYADAAPCAIELQEGLEQLRFLDAGIPVGVTVLDPPGWEMIELNNPTDVPLIEAQLSEREKHETSR